MSAQGKIEVRATNENLTKVTEFIDLHLEEIGCPMKKMMQIDLAVEEIYVNVASYAYAPGTGDVTVCFEPQQQPAAAVITFMDQGVPYNPLAKEDPDVTLPTEERSIGGLGIFITKKSMDEISYEYREGKNILVLKKYL